MEDDSNEYGNIDFNRQPTTSKAGKGDGDPDICQDDDSENDYINVDGPLEMKRNKTEQHESPHLAEPRKTSKATARAAVCGTKSVVILYILVLITSAVWTVSIIMVITKYSAMSKEIEHLKEMHSAWTSNGSLVSSDVEKIKTQVSVLNTNDKSISSVIQNISSQIAHLNTKDCVKTSCPCNWESFSGHCYYVSQILKTWGDAKTYCNSHNSKLAVINNDEEKDCLQGKISGIHWVGLSDAENEGDWKWEDGQAFNTRSDWWATGQPDNYREEDCGEINKNGKLNDNRCDQTQKWICEKSA
ncbi:CD209 antigen-like protein 2 [Amia ocellicauda]|uniref:CD209 antigen-like protein 2 n=1 Tax=Amia ocellicauda TaxID=2972642 RepID=UPI0034649B20